MTQAGLELDNVIQYPRETPAAYAPLTEIEPVQLITPHLIEAFWPLVRPQLERCVVEAMKGEMEVDDIKTLLLQGKVAIVIFTNDRTGTNPYRKVELSIVVEPILYPRMSGINILAIGGSNFRNLHKKYGEQFMGWARMNGAQFVDALVGPGMQRIAKRLGFKPVYTHVRYKFSEN